MAKNETEPKIPIWAIKLITRLDELSDSLDITIRQHDIYDKEKIIMYRYIADIILQRAERIKGLADKLKEDEDYHVRHEAERHHKY